MLPRICVMGFTAAAFLLNMERLPAQDKAVPTAQQIEKWVQDLDSRVFSVREQAQKELLRSQGQALGALHKALKAPPSLEFQCRAERILKQLAIWQPGGEVVGGLKVRLTTDREAAKVGDVVMFTVMLANMTDQPMNLEVGYTTCGNYFECGSVLTRRLADGKDEAPKWTVGFCGTGAKAILATVPAKSVLEYKMPTRLTGAATLNLGAANYAMMPLDESRPNTFRVVLQQSGVAPKGPPGGKYTPDPPANPDAAYWKGKVSSNEVTLKVVR